MKSIYKEWFEFTGYGANDEAIEKERELRRKGYDLFEIYRFGYNGKDGKYHCEVFVFADDVCDDINE